MSRCYLSHLDKTIKPHLDNLCPEMHNELKKVDTCPICLKLTKTPIGSKCKRIHKNFANSCDKPDKWCLEMGSYYCSCV